MSEPCPKTRDTSRHETVTAAPLALAVLLPALLVGPAAAQELLRADRPRSESTAVGVQRAAGRGDPKHAAATPPPGPFLHGSGTVPVRESYFEHYAAPTPRSPFFGPAAHELTQPALLVRQSGTGRAARAEAPVAARLDETGRMPGAATGDEGARPTAKKAGPESKDGTKSEQARERAAPVTAEATAQSGRAIDLAALRGRVVLVHFWATWCPISHAEAPALVRAYERYHTRGLEVVGVALDASAASDVAQAILRLGFSWEQVHERDADGGLASRLGVASPPGAVLLDRDGAVAARGDDARGEALARRLAVLFGD